MKRTIVTTSWDDGHILDLTLAALLRKYHLAATFYISPEDREIAGLKKILEDILGREVRTFCYPGGSYRPRHKQMVREAGFAGARTVDRFATEAGGDPFAMPTTIHAYRHWSDVRPIFNEAGPGEFFHRYLNWDDLAIAMFDGLIATGGVFHLWGHSWEIEENGDWNRLERVFKHISDRPDISYATNGALL